MNGFGFTAALPLQIEKDLSLLNKFRKKFNEIPSDYLKQWDYDQLLHLYKHSSDDYHEFLTISRLLGFSYRIQEDYVPKQRKPVKVHRQAFDYIRLLFDFMGTFEQAISEHKEMNRNLKPYYAYCKHLAQ